MSPLPKSSLVLSVHSEHGAAFDRCAAQARALAAELKLKVALTYGTNIYFITEHTNLDSLCAKQVKDKAHWDAQHRTDIL